MLTLSPMPVISHQRKKLHPRPSSCGFSCFLAPVRDLTVGFECFFIPSVCACEPASASSASGQLIMFSALPTVKGQRPERQNLRKTGIFPHTPPLPSFPTLGNHPCLRQKKTCYPSFLTDSKALSAYGPMPPSLADNLLLHQETTQRSRRMEVV